jgi:glycine betaine/proline transport system ATP-binding protein
MLLGPSGAGKTTLFRLLNATPRPTGGKLSFDGNDVSAMSSRELRQVNSHRNDLSTAPTGAVALGA